MKYFLAFDIGCIECGEGSSPLGLFKTEAEASAACEQAAILQQADWTGQHDFEVFPVETPE